MKRSRLVANILLVVGLVLLSGILGLAQTTGMHVQVIHAQKAVSPRLAAVGSRPLATSATTPISGMASGFSFDGMGNTNGWSVPDANGAVGATQYVQWVNTQFAVYDKTSGALLYGPAAGNTLWASLGGLCASANNGDPIAQYDKLAGRWVMTQRAMGATGPYYQCVAVSTTSDATGTYNLYAFQLPNAFPDYPKLGIWPDAYFLSVNELVKSTWNCHISRTPGPRPMK